MDDGAWLRSLNFLKSRNTARRHSIRASRLSPLHFNEQLHSSTGQYRER